MLEFLELVNDFLIKVFAYNVLPGISLFTVLFYNLILVLTFTVFTRKR